MRIARMLEVLDDGDGAGLGMNDPEAASAAPDSTVSHC